MQTGEAKSDPAYPVFEDSLPAPVVEEGRYTVRFARSRDELDAIQKLRFEVFNLELGEGLDESFDTERDRDRFDPVCHHLLVIDNRNSLVVGTYRMQTVEMANRHEGFYTADEFELGGLPDEVLGHAIEVGRACVARAYRNRQVLFLLWRGLAAYMEQNARRYLFGCCSLTSQDPEEGLRTMRYLRREGHVHPTHRVKPRAGWECYDEAADAAPPSADEPSVDLPKLFRLYLRYGAKVCGPPALDRFFKTIDYLVLLDVEQLDAQARELFYR